MSTSRQLHQPLGQAPVKSCRRLDGATAMKDELMPQTGRPDRSWYVIPPEDLFSNASLIPGGIPVSTPLSDTTEPGSNPTRSCNMMTFFLAIQDDHLFGDPDDENQILAVQNHFLLTISGSKQEMAIQNFDLSSLAMHPESPINLLHLNPKQSTFTTHCCPGKLTE